MRSSRGNNKRVTIRLMGGLGNQLFQYAAGLSFASHEGRELILDINENNIRRNEFGLPDLLSYQQLQEGQIRFPSLFAGLTNRVSNLLLRSSLNNSKWEFIMIRKFTILILSVIYSTYFKERVRVKCANNLGFTELNPSSGKSEFYIGYYQSFRYSQSSEVMKLLKSLKLDSKIVRYFEKTAEVAKPLVVHVRLGDYSQEPKFGTLTQDYYSQSIKWHFAHASYGEIWVFSDDMAAAKQVIPQEYHSLVSWIDPENASAAEILEIMRLGAGYVLANSTLSWWGANLTRSQSALIIAPSPWFNAMEEPKDLIPLSWVRMER